MILVVRYIYIHIEYISLCFYGYAPIPASHPSVVAPSPHRPPKHAPGIEGSAAAPRLPPCPRGTPAVTSWCCMNVYDVCVYIYILYYNILVWILYMDIIYIYMYIYIYIVYTWVSTVQFHPCAVRNGQLLPTYHGYRTKPLPTTVSSNQDS